MVARVFATWHSDVREAKRRRVVTARFAARFANRRALAVLNAWLDFCFSRRTGRAIVTKFRAKFARRAELAVFAAWRGASGAKRRERALLSRFARKWRQRFANSVFLAWFETVAEWKHARTLMLKVSKHFYRRLERSMLDAWVAHVDKRRRLRAFVRRILSRLASGGVGKAFHHWTYATRALGVAEAHAAELAAERAERATAGDDVGPRPLYRQVCWLATVMARRTQRDARRVAFATWRDGTPPPPIAAATPLGALDAILTHDRAAVSEGGPNDSVSAAAAPTALKALTAQFEAIDADGSGAISRDELGAMLRKRAAAAGGRAGALSEADVAAMLDAADADGDGEIGVVRGVPNDGYSVVVVKRPISDATCLSPLQARSTLTSSKRSPPRRRRRRARAATAPLAAAARATTTRTTRTTMRGRRRRCGGGGG